MRNSTRTRLTFEKTTFETSIGVRQGGPESLNLFNLYVDFVMRVFLEKSSYIEDIKFFQHKFRINCRAFTREQRSYMRNNDLRSWGTSTLPWSGYADDLVLFLQSQAALQKATELLDDVFASFGLSINKSKTETMVLNSNETPDTVSKTSTSSGI